MTHLTRVCPGNYVEREYGMRLVGQRGSWVLFLPDDSKYVFTGRDPANRNRIVVCRRVSGIRSISQIAKGDIGRCVDCCQEQLLLPMDGGGDGGRVALLKGHDMMEVPMVDILPFHSIRSISTDSSKRRKKR